MGVTASNTDLLDVGNTPKWFVFDVVGERLTVGTETFTMMAIPINTVMVDASICCTVERGAGGTSKLDVNISTGPRDVFTGTADNGGAVDVIDRSVTVDGSAFPIAAACNLQVTNTVAAGTIASVASWRVACLLYRTDR